MKKMCEKGIGLGRRQLLLGALPALVLGAQGAQAQEELTGRARIRASQSR